MSEETVIVIKPWVVMTIVLFITIGIIAYNLPKKTNNVVITKTEYQTETSKDLLSESKNGIDVSITDIQKTQTEMVVSATMSNHQFDLSDPAIQNRSSLDGIPPVDYRVLSSEMGGHHVEVEFVFMSRSGKNLDIGVLDDLLFSFKLL